MALFLQLAQLATLAYIASLLYDCLSSLDLIAYGEEDEEETTVTVLREVVDLDHRFVDDDFDSQRELHHD